MARLIIHPIGLIMKGTVLETTDSTNVSESLLLKCCITVVKLIFPQKLIVFVSQLHMNWIFLYENVIKES